MTRNHHYVVVNFSTTPANQAQALSEIGDYVGSFLSQQPGFITSRLFASNDGERIVHQAEWSSEADFQQAGVLARAHPDLPKLMAYAPNGSGYTLARTF